jgi:hypothetical protein
VVPATQFGQGQRTGYAAAPLTEDGDVAEFRAQLPFLCFGVGVTVGEDVQQMQPVLLSTPDTDAATVVVFSRIRMSHETSRER